MKRTVLLFVLLYLCQYGANAQSKAMEDSLRTALKTAREDTNKVNVLNGLGWQMYLKANFDSAGYYEHKAVQLADKLNFQDGKACAYATFGGIYFYQGNYPEALNDYSVALKASEAAGNKSYIAAVYMGFGNVYLNQGNYPEAMRNNIIALKINEEIGNKSQIAGTRNSIGEVYEEQHNYPEALKNYFAALKINETAGDKIQIATEYNNIGNVYEMEDNDSEALKNYFAALKINEAAGNKDMAAANYSNIAGAYDDGHNYPEALKNYFASLKISEAIGDKKLVAGNYDGIGNLYVRQNRAREGREWIQKSLALSKEIGNKVNIESGYEHLSSADSTSGDYKGAYENYKQAALYRDSLFNEDNTRRLTQTAMQYEFDKKEAAGKEAQEKKDIRQNNIRNFILAGLAGMLVFLVVVYRQRNKIKREKKRSDELLQNILPVEVSNELKERGATTAKEFDAVTVLFTDFVGFTKASERMSSQQLVEELHNCFKGFDEIIAKYNIEKIKTIGDAYLAVSGLPVVDNKHAFNIVNAALEIRDFVVRRREQLGDQTFEIRIGIHSGSVVAGIVGIKKFAYDIWGDTVNTAARMEQSSETGKVNISGATYELVKGTFACTHRGKIQAKNKGEMDMYFVDEDFTHNR